MSNLAFEEQDSPATSKNATYMNRYMMILTVAIVITVFFLYTRSFTNDAPTCNGYITNVYLYVLLGILILAFSVLFIAKRKIPITKTKSIIFIILSFVFLFLLFFINPRNVIFNHLVWVIFLVSLSVSLYMIWKNASYRGIFTSTLVMTILLVIVLTLIATVKSEWIQLNWISFLTMALFVGLLAWIIPMFFTSGTGGTENMSMYYKILSAIFVFIFMILIMYDTKLLRVKAEHCVVPDYPRDSLGLILDTLNLFTNITTVRM